MLKFSMSIFGDSICEQGINVFLKEGDGEITITVELPLVIPFRDFRAALMDT